MLARPQRRIWAAQTHALGTTIAAGARRRGSTLASLATLAVLGLLVTAAPAGAIILNTTPTYTPGSGWTCTAPVAGTEKNAGGSNYSCSGTASAFSNLYLGVKRDTVYKWIDRKRMPAHKVGSLWKFRKDEIDEWVRSGEARDKRSEHGDDD